MKFDEKGREVPDKTPVEIPLNFKRPETMEERIRRAVRQEVSQMAAAEGFETFEEADDFEVEDEEEFVTPYEMTVMQEEALLQKDRDGDIIDKRGNKAADKGDDNGSSKSDAVDEGGVRDPAARSRVSEEKRDKSDNSGRERAGEVDTSRRSVGDRNANS